MTNKTNIMIFMALLLLLNGCSSRINGDIVKKITMEGLDYIVIGNREKRNIEIINRDQVIREIKLKKSFDELIIIDGNQLHIAFAIAKERAILFDLQNGENLGTIELGENELIFDIAYFYDKHGLNIGVILGAIEKEYGDSINIYRYQQGSLKKIYERDLTTFNPWAIKSGDVDGDGESDISIGVYKEARLHKIMAKRPFFFNWDGEKIYAKWLGSRLSKPFENYYLIDINGDKIDELIAIEYLRDRNQVISIYSWNGFGFTLTSEMEYDGTILDIKKSNIDKDPAWELVILSEIQQSSYITIADYISGKLEVIDEEEGDFRKDGYDLAFYEEELKLYYLRGRELKVKTIGGIINE